MWCLSDVDLLRDLVSLKSMTVGETQPFLHAVLIIHTVDAVLLLVMFVLSSYVCYFVVV
jgi:hypothetical protein